LESTATQEMKMTLPKIIMTKKVDANNNQPFEVSLVYRKAGWNGYSDVADTWFVRTENLHPRDTRWFHKAFDNKHAALDAYCNIN